MYQPSELNKSIKEKYNLQFYFFTTKFVNELIYSIGTSNSIHFQDWKFYDDDVQYLRRSYRSRTLEGKPEIEERIKMIADYYQENRMITYQVPMMFITNTKQLFIKRHKRLKKLKKKDDSSKSQNLTSSFGCGSLTFSFDVDYLKELKINLSELMNSEETSLNINDQIDSEVHDIFSDHSNYQFEDENLFKLKQTDFPHHLICDFQEVDIQKAINFYKDIKKSKNGSTIMSEILQEQLKLSSKNSFKTVKTVQQNIIKKPQTFKKPNKASSKNSKQSILSSYITAFGPQHKSRQKYLQQKRHNRYSDNLKLNKYVQQYNRNHSNVVQNAEQSIQIEKNTLKENRQKIRQKAEKLLQRIKAETIDKHLR